MAISNNGIGMALSKDEQLIAGNCASYNCIWDVKQGKTMIKWANQQGKQGNMCFANNSKLLFQSLDSCKKVWNCYNTKQKLIRKANLGYSFDCSVSSDSTILAISIYRNIKSFGQVHLIDISTWKIAQKLKLTMFCEDQNYLNFSSDDQYIGTGNAYGEVKLFRNVVDDKEDEGDQIQKLQIQCLEKLQK